MHLRRLLIHNPLDFSLAIHIKSLLNCAGIVSLVCLDSGYIGRSLVTRFEILIYATLKPVKLQGTALNPCGPMEAFESLFNQTPVYVRNFFISDTSTVRPQPRHSRIRDAGKETLEGKWISAMPNILEMVTENVKVLDVRGHSLPEPRRVDE